MKNKYSDETIFSLLDNDLFLQWVIHPTHELEIFWKQETDKNNELKDCIYDLKNIINRIKVEEPTLSTGDKQLIWEQVRLGISNKKTKKKIFAGIYSRIAVAATIAGMVAGSYLYLNNQQEDIDYSLLINEIQSPQAGNISLILSDNKVVDIEKDSINVVYDHTGKINIDSVTIESAENNKASLNQLIVPYGKITSLTLSDGTRIWVNSGSKLIYPSVFEKNKREIFLIGEIYLDVTKNRDCPFIIKTHHMDVNVLGTTLNISAYNDENIQSVVLVSGAVNVKSKELKGTYDIYPDQMFSYGTGSNKVDIQEVDVNHHISWIHGYLLLNRERLDRVLQKLERHFNVSFTYNPEDFNNIYVGGKLDLKDSLETALKYISIAAPVNYTIHDDNIRIELIP